MKRITALLSGAALVILFSMYAGTSCGGDITASPTATPINSTQEDFETAPTVEPLNNFCGGDRRLCGYGQEKICCDADELCCACPNGQGRPSCANPHIGCVGNC
jgi:hypothetical protein